MKSPSTKGLAQSSSSLHQASGREHLGSNNRTAAGPYRIWPLTKIPWQSLGCKEHDLVPYITEENLRRLGIRKCRSSKNQASLTLVNSTEGTWNLGEQTRPRANKWLCVTLEFDSQKPKQSSWWTVNQNKLAMHRKRVRRIERSSRNPRPLKSERTTSVLNLDCNSNWRLLCPQILPEKSLLILKYFAAPKIPPLTHIWGALCTLKRHC